MNWKIKIGIVLLIVLGPFLAVMGYQSKAKHDRLVEKGKVVEGFITGGDWKRGRKGGKTYHFDVRYTPENQAVITKKFSVGRTYFDSKVSADTIVNPSAQVRYNQEDPNESELVGEEENQGFLLWVGPLVCLVGVFGTWYAFKPKPIAV